MWNSANYKEKLYRFRGRTIIFTWVLGRGKQETLCGRYKI